MFLRRQLPNFITLSNLLCGCLATFFALHYELTTASWLILAGALLDFFDGFVARLLGVSGELGKQLDSLADVISFGMAPACICFALVSMGQMHTFGSVDFWNILRFSPFIMVAFSAFRLGKFNIDERQSVNFIGLPTPANALLWLSFPLIMAFEPHNIMAMEVSTWIRSVLAEPYVLLILMVVMSFLLVAEVELFSLKVGSAGLRANLYPLLFISISAILLFALSFAAVPFILLLYLLLSIIKNLSKKQA